MPPAPGSQRSRVSCCVRLATDSKVLPPSVERSSAPGAAPSQSSPGSRPGRTCHVFSSLRPDSSGSPISSARSQRLAHVGRALHGAAVGVRVGRRVERAVAGVDDRVEDVPALERRLVELPRAAVVRMQLEEALPRTDKERDAHGRSLTYRLTDVRPADRSRLGGVVVVPRHLRRRVPRRHHPARPERDDRRSRPG